jgi:hypothetical protein
MTRWKWAATWSACRWAAIFALVCGGLEAQAPERSQEVEVPGLGIMLRAGWQLLFHDGCRFAVPLSWHRDPDEAFARGPDGSTFSIQMLRVTSWFAHKADVRDAFGRLRAVHEDSSRRLWFEIDDGPSVQHYIAVPDGPNVCAGWLVMRGRAGTSSWDTIKRIADSIGLAPEGWPPEDK